MSSQQDQDNVKDDENQNPEQKNQEEPIQTEQKDIVQENEKQDETLTYQNLIFVNKQEIQDAFNKRLEQGEIKLTFLQAKELNQELEQILKKSLEGFDLDIDNAAEKHQQDSEFDFSLTFEEYYALLQIWAENKDSNNNENQNPQDDNLLQNQTIKSEEGQNEQQLGIYGQHNKMIIERFLNSFQHEVYNYFYEYSKVKEVNQEAKIKCQDVPLVIRVSLYLDNIIIQATKEDQEEFFTKPDSQKEILLAIDNYLKEKQKEETLETYQFTFNDFIDFLQYFVTTQGQIFLRKWEDQDFENGAEKFGNEQESQLENEIKQNIEKYERMLQQTQVEGEKIVITNMLNAMYAQLSKVQLVKKQQYQNKRKYPTKAPLTKEQKREMNLQEIYSFYCKQQYSQAPIFSFDRILHDSHTMNLSNFLLFCKQFNITNYNVNLSKKAIPNLFQKTSPNYKELTLQQFKQILEKIALVMYQDQNDQYPTEIDKVETFYKYIAIDDPNIYRRNMVLQQPPFNIQDKDGFRVLPRDRNKPLEIHQVSPKIKLELERRKQEKQLLIAKKYEGYIPSPYIHSQKHSYSVPSLQKNQSMILLHKYADIQHTKQISKLNLQGKVNWQQLEQLSYADMNKINQSKFQPTDLFDKDNNEEDRYYLGDYDLAAEQKRKLDQSNINRKQQENYGVIKQSLRPAQKQKQQISQNQNIFQPYNPDNQSDQFTNYNSQVNQQLLGSQSVKYQPNKISDNYLQRAQQIDQDQKQRQQSIIDKLNQQNQQNIDRGMQTIKKKK